MFITVNNHLDPINLTPFVINYSYLFILILYTKNYSQDNRHSLNDELPLKRGLLTKSQISAVIVYSNADTDKSKILSDNKGKAGIYQWTHKESGKTYIGSAVNISNRLKDYYSKNHLERNKTMYINNALLQHGYDAFSLTILEYVDISTLSIEEARKLIILREQFFLDYLSPEYNILKVAGSSLDFIHSEKTKTKISEALTGENHPRGMLGKSYSAETKAKISKTLISIEITGENHPMFGKTGKNHPLFGKAHSAETIAKMSETHLGKKLSKETKTKISFAKGTRIFVYSSDYYELINIFNSARKAGVFFNVSKDIIIKYAKNGQKFKEKW